MLPPGQVLPDEAVLGRRIDITRFLPAKERAIAAHVSQSGWLITDDPAGFALPPEFLAHFRQPYEVLLETRPG